MSTLFDLPKTKPAAPPAPTFTERDMLDLLLARYNTERPGTIADQYVRAEHVRSTQRVYALDTRVADFIAIDKHHSRQAMIGHEVKVSRADWLAELRDPTKADPVKRYCRQWYLVVPDAGIVKPGELPDGWGLLVKAGARLRVKVRAPLLDPEPMPLDFVAGLAQAVQRTAMREPLHRDARTVWLWSERLGESRQVCQACGGAAPCGLHQPGLVGV